MSSALPKRKDEQEPKIRIRIWMSVTKACVHLRAIGENATNFELCRAA